MSQNLAGLLLDFISEQDPDGGYSPAHIMSRYLISQGSFGEPETANWPLYVSHLPDQEGFPDNVAAIYDSIGLKECRLMSGENVINYGVTVLFRSLKNQDGWDKAKEVINLLEMVQDVVVPVGTDLILLSNVHQVKTPLFLGLERGTKRRGLFSVNALLTFKPED